MLVRFSKRSENQKVLNYPRRKILRLPLFKGPLFQNKINILENHVSKPKSEENFDVIYKAVPSRMLMLS